MQEKKLSLEYWAEAIATDVYILNLLPTKALNFQTLFEALTWSKPHVDHLRVFGCLVYRHIDSQQRVKFDPKSPDEIFISYCDRSIQSL